MINTYCQWYSYTFFCWRNIL